MAVFDFSAHKVLMVDTDRQSIDRTKAIYELKGLSGFKGVSSANAAMAAIKNFHPSLAFINADPGSGGEELIQMLRDYPDGRFNDLPILVMLKKVDTKRLRALCKIGIEGALRKPIDPVRLLRLTRLTIRRPQRFISIRSYFGPNRRQKSKAHFDGYDRRIKHDGPENFVPKEKNETEIKMVPIEHHGINRDGITMVPIKGVGINKKDITMVPIEGHKTDKDGVTWIPIEGFEGKDGITMVPIEGREGRDGDISFVPIEGFGDKGGLSYIPIEGEGNSGDGITMVPIKGFGKNDNEPEYKYADQEEFAADLEVTPVGTLSDKGELSTEAIQSFEDKGEIAFDQLGPDDDTPPPPYRETSILGQSFEEAMAEAKGMTADTGTISHTDLLGNQSNGEMETISSGDLLKGERGGIKDKKGKTPKPPQIKPIDLDFSDDETPKRSTPEPDDSGMVDFGSLDDILAPPAETENKGGLDISAALEAAESAKVNLSKEKREKEKREKEKAIRIAKGKEKAADALKQIDEKQAKPKKKPTPKASGKETTKKAPTPPKPVKVAPVKKKALPKKTKPEKAPPPEKVKAEPKRKKLPGEDASAPEIQKAILTHKLWLDSGGKEGKQCILPRGDMRGHELAGKDFTLSRIPGGKFNGADCSETIFRKSFLSRSDFTDAKLTKCDFAVSRLKQVNLSNAKLSFSNLHGADLARANLTGAKLMRCDMSATNLDGTNLIGVNLSSVKGLLPDQLLRAKIDNTTKLPYHLRNNDKLIAATTAKKKPTRRRKAATKSAKAKAS